MDDEKIIEFIRNLEAEVSKNSAEAKFVSFGEVALYANKEGYLRMALELMKCAFDETEGEADLRYLFTADSEFEIDHLVKTREELEFFTS